MVTSSSYSNGYDFTSSKLVRSWKGFRCPANAITTRRCSNTCTIWADGRVTNGWPRMATRSVSARPLTWSSWCGRACGEMSKSLLFQPSRRLLHRSCRLLADFGAEVGDDRSCSWREFLELGPYHSASWQGMV